MRKQKNNINQNNLLNSLKKNKPDKKYKYFLSNKP